MNDPVYECFVLYGAYGSLCDYLATRVSPVDVDPQDLYGRACGCDHDRLAALLYAHGHGEDMDEAGRILDELLEGAREGRRPRTGRELGLAPEMFEGGSA